MKKAVIVLPTYNERENISILIPEIFKVIEPIKNWDVSILVVDDNSPDGTGLEVKSLQKKYVGKLHLVTGQKQGLGSAYMNGFRFALDNLHSDYIFEMDSDRQHPPKIIPQFLEKIDLGADFVIGSRYIKGGGIPKNWALYRKFFSYFGNWVLKFGFMKFAVNDWTSGYRAIKAEFISQTLPLYKNLSGYTFQIGILDNAIKNNLKIAEVPFYFEDRRKGESKINTLEFVINNLLYILFNSSFVKFAFVGLFGAIIDFSFSYLFIELLNIMVLISTIISAEMAIVSNFILNNYWSFKHKKIEHKDSGFVKSFLNFNTVSVGNIFIQAILMQVSVMLLPLKFWYVYKVLIIACIIIPYSYFMYNRFIWKNKNKES